MKKETNSMTGKPRIQFTCKVCSFNCITSGLPLSCPKCGFNPIKNLTKERKGIEDDILEKL